MERPPQCRGRSENGVIPTVSVGRRSLDITLGSVITCILQGGMSHGLVCLMRHRPSRLCYRRTMGL